MIGIVCVECFLVGRQGDLKERGEEAEYCGRGGVSTQEHARRFLHHMKIRKNGYIKQLLTRATVTIYYLSPEAPQYGCLRHLPTPNLDEKYDWYRMKYLRSAIVPRSSNPAWRVVIDDIKLNARQAEMTDNVERRPRQQRKSKIADKFGPFFLSYSVGLRGWQDESADDVFGWCC